MGTKAAFPVPCNTWPFPTPGTYDLGGPTPEEVPWLR